MTSLVSPLREALRVLVVDDDDQMLRTIGDILRFRGYLPMAALSGEAGLSIVEDMAVGPAIALVDLRLPDMDGIDLIGRLHEISASTEVVILTGNASVDSAVRALREQSYDYLIKPVAPEQLLNSMDRAGDRWQRRRAEAALAESEGRLRRVFDCVSDGLFVTDHQGRITDANAAASKLTAENLSVLCTKSFGALISPAPGAPGQEHPAKTPPLPPPGEYRLARADGTIRAIDVRTSGLTSDLYVYTVRDLTVQRGLEEQLNHAQKMEAIGRLAGGVAHDFNNMLTAILAYGELLSTRLGPEHDGHEEVDEIIKAGRRAAALTSQLLAFGRKTLLQPRVLDVAAIVADLENMLTRLIGEDVKLVTHYEPMTSRVRADPGQLGQVVMNLAVNARDAMPNGGTLSITVSRVAFAEDHTHMHGVVPAGSYVLLQVTDTGMGMNAETIAHIFEPFFTTKEAGKGTGLGLSTTYGIVSQSGGIIEVDSVLGRGTTFRIYLPSVGRNSDPSATPPRPARAVDQGSGTILLVEDERAIRELIARILQASGYRVLIASNGAEALRLAAEHPGTIDLLTTDVVMPGMTGPELVAKLHETRPGLTVLYMSGYASGTGTHQALDGLDVTLLQKPFTSSELMQKIAECTGRANR
ncbi:MAG: response regulator [bacterium]